MVKGNTTDLHSFTISAGIILGFCVSQLGVITLAYQSAGLGMAAPVGPFTFESKWIDWKYHFDNVASVKIS